MDLQEHLGSCTAIELRHRREQKKQRHTERTQLYSTSVYIVLWLLTDFSLEVPDTLSISRDIYTQTQLFRTYSRVYLQGSPRAGEQSVPQPAFHSGFATVTSPMGGSRTSVIVPNQLCRRQSQSLLPGMDWLSHPIQSLYTHPIFLHRSSAQYVSFILEF